MTRAQSPRDKRALQAFASRVSTRPRAAEGASGRERTIPDFRCGPGSGNSTDGNPAKLNERTGKKMAKSTNVVIFSGNLGRDPEIRYTEGGNAVCNARLAISDRSKAGGQWEDVTYWVGLVLFGKSAENFAAYTQKGSRVVVNGSLQIRDYKRKDGTDGREVEVRVSDFTLMDRKGEGPSDSAPSNGNGARMGGENLPF